MARNEKKKKCRSDSMWYPDSVVMNAEKHQKNAPCESRLYCSCVLQSISRSKRIKPLPPSPH